MIRLKLGLACLTILTLISSGTSRQMPLLKSQWSLELAPEYDYLGPFPISAREQQWLSPTYPHVLDLSKPFAYSETAKYPSSLADSGDVSWNQSVTHVPGEYALSYPSVQWKQLRSIFGWAALQHHSVLHTTLTLTPTLGTVDTQKVYLRLSLKQASFIAFVPRASTTQPIQWIEGDIYDQASFETQTPYERIISLELPVSSSVGGVVEFDVFISVDYEIRLFGDPTFTEGGSDVPVSRVKLSLEPVDSDELGISIGGRFFVPDFVDGWAQGDVLGVYVQNSDTWETLLSVQYGQDAISFTLERESTRFAPLQKRLIPLRIAQHSPVPSSTNELSLTFKFASGAEKIVTVKIAHKAHWLSDPSPTLTIRQTHRHPFVSDSVLLPPILPPNDAPEKPILALHGAGVDVHSPFWTSAIARRERNWVVLARGLTPWGHDWRGPSAADALGALDALKHRNEEEHFAPTAVVVGHSNGGQGTFHLASHYPDLFEGSMPVAAYLSAASYVPLSLSVGVHVTDPILQGILLASTAGGDNDLFLGNLASRTVRAFHGGIDENVPIWNPRKAAEIIRAYNASADVSFTQVPDKLHWWSDVFRSEASEAAINELVNNNDSAVSGPGTVENFSLTVMWPRESGSLNGWKIEQTSVPGRLARIVVQGHVIQTANVQVFSVQRVKGDFIIDGQQVRIDRASPGEEARQWFKKTTEGEWDPSAPLNIPESGPISRILSYGSPITLVIPGPSSGSAQLQLQHLALRLAQNLLIYLNIDSDIVKDSDILSEETENAARREGVIVFGGPRQNAYAASVLHDSKVPIQFSSASGSDGFTIQRRTFASPDIGLLFMLEKTLFIHATSPEGYERAVRAFPLRTGVANPEWLVVGSEADKLATGGILGAGFWDNEGQYSASMSWLA